MSNEIFCIITDILPILLMENDPGIAAFVDEILEVFAAERGVTAEEGVSDDTERPHIYWLSMTLLEHDFGSGVAK